MEEKWKSKVISFHASHLSLSLRFLYGSLFMFIFKTTIETLASRPCLAAQIVEKSKIFVYFSLSRLVDSYQYSRARVSGRSLEFDEWIYSMYEEKNVDILFFTISHHAPAHASRTKSYVRVRTRRGKDERVKFVNMKFSSDDEAQKRKFSDISSRFCFLFLSVCSHLDAWLCTMSFCVYNTDAEIYLMRSRAQHSGDSEQLFTIIMPSSFLSHAKWNAIRHSTFFFSRSKRTLLPSWVRRVRFFSHESVSSVSINYPNAYFISSISHRWAYWFQMVNSTTS